MKKGDRVVKLGGPWDCCGMVWQHVEHPDVLRIDFIPRRRGSAEVSAYTTKKKFLATARAHKAQLAKIARPVQRGAKRKRQ